MEETKIADLEPLGGQKFLKNLIFSEQGSRARALSKAYLLRTLSYLGNSSFGPGTNLRK